MQLSYCQASTAPSGPQITFTTTVQYHYYFFHSVFFFFVNYLIANEPMLAEYIKSYFDAGHEYPIILDMLSTYHQVTMSICTLKTHLKQAGLF